MSPGPWWLRQVSDEEPILIYAIENGEPTIPTPIASVYRASDARLIAAAPDLLASLKAVLFAFEDDGDHRGAPEIDCIKRARAAIAKAEGAESAAMETEK